jgi:cell division protein FtsB
MLCLSGHERPPCSEVFGRIAGAIEPFAAAPAPVRPAPENALDRCPETVIMRAPNIRRTTLWARPLAQAFVLLASHKDEFRKTNKKSITALAFFGDPGYKHYLKDLLDSLSQRLNVSSFGRRAGFIIIFTLIAIYGLVALRGPQGIPALLEKRREVRQLEERNAALAAEIERRRERIRRLEQNASEQEMEIRKQLKLLRPGETTFILPEAPKQAPGQTPAPAPPQ